MVLSHVNSGRFPENPAFPRARPSGGAPQARRAPSIKGAQGRNAGGRHKEQGGTSAPARRPPLTRLPASRVFWCPKNFLSERRTVSPARLLVRTQIRVIVLGSRGVPSGDHFAEALLLAPLSQSEGDSCEERGTPGEPRRAVIGRQPLSFTSLGGGDEGGAGVLILQGGF